jgi:hypothetical protein
MPPGTVPGCPPPSLLTLRAPLSYTLVTVSHVAPGATAAAAGVLKCSGITHNPEHFGARVTTAGTVCHYIAVAYRCLQDSLWMLVAATCPPPLLKHPPPHTHTHMHQQ